MTSAAALQTAAKLFTADEDALLKRHLQALVRVNSHIET